MNLSIHLALTLHYGIDGHSHISFFFSWNEPVLSFLFVFEKLSKLIQDQNIGRTLLTKQEIRNCQ